MEVKILSSKAEGKTLTSAFDLALAKVELQNYNLIKISSIIPKDAKVIQAEKYENPDKKVGDILHVVISEKSSNKKEQKITCGLGWILADEGGVFYEESLLDSSREIVEKKLLKGLEDAKKIRNWRWIGEPRMNIEEHMVEKNGCVFVVAVYDL
ncbi:MAG: pyruvoyl-dependent arginine decarboxylase [Candidatus Bathyarchaeota archaeon]|nr:pyruvoyl-dependent arginine decarboxylase [Candidatus Bathyarchaeota archaeon]